MGSLTSNRPNISGTTTTFEKCMKAPILGPNFSAKASRCLKPWPFPRYPDNPKRKSIRKYDPTINLISVNHSNFIGAVC